MNKSAAVLLLLGCLLLSGHAVGAESNKRYALIVGVGKYQGSGSDTIFGDRDAAALAQALKDFADFPKDHVRVLSSASGDPLLLPTQVNIWREMRELLNYA